MTKRTSKSASAIKRTSSRSGTSARTAGTGAKRNGAKTRNSESKGLGKFGRVVRRVRKMSEDEFKKSVVDAGIIDSEGRLTRHYRDGDTDGTQESGAAS